HPAAWPNRCLSSVPFGSRSPTARVPRLQVPTCSGHSPPTGNCATIMCRKSSPVRASAGPMDTPSPLKDRLQRCLMSWHRIRSSIQRNAIIQDVALTYAELAKWEARLVRLQQDDAQAQQMEQAVTERVQEGVDS